MGNPQNRSRAPKRKKVFCGNVPAAATNNENSNNSESLKSQKIKRHRESMDADSSVNLVDDENYNFILNFKILKRFFMPLLCCPECNSGNVELVDNLSLRMGYAHKLSVNCKNCPYESETFTSDECKSEDSVQGRRKFEINVRAVVAFREIGRGHSAMADVSRCLNMFSLTHKTCNDLLNNGIYNAYENAAKLSMEVAAKETVATCSPADGKMPECRMSIDGTWQKRGHTSINGVVTAMTNGKCIDAHVMSKHCKKCDTWLKRKNDPDCDYDIWLQEHIENDECEINHTASSGAMESAGAVTIFQRSIEKNGLIYSKYLGDGDTSSFSDVVDSDPYKEHGIVIEKLECVGHVQKRLGSRLRTLIDDHKGTKTPLSGKGKLTKKTMNSMQNYYGNAIRQNKNDLYGMKKATGAILWHCTKFTDSAYRHRFCPRTEDSWCKYHKNDPNYTPSVNLEKWIHDLLLPTFKSLSDDELLRKCLHGDTQNPNESINSIIWKKCPKTVFVSRSVLEIGVNSAILEFNQGSFGVESVFDYFGFSAGHCFALLSESRDTERVQHGLKKSSEKGKQRRRTIRAIHKGYLDKEKETEKETYKAGGF